MFTKKGPRTNLCGMPLETSIQVIAESSTVFYQLLIFIILATTPHFFVLSMRTVDNLPCSSLDQQTFILSKRKSARILILTVCFHINLRRWKLFCQVRLPNWSLSSQLGYFFNYLTLFIYLNNFFLFMKFHIILEAQIPFVFLMLFLTNGWMLTYVLCLALRFSFI
jgi:hypothetical protein